METFARDFKNVLIFAMIVHRMFIGFIRVRYDGTKNTLRVSTATRANRIS